mmetsp:Transcript_6405/g.5730  ORF Transcript_6405/g.5730 Transcript_6405/m.5730 type:complete len:87 (+) Transcript_6405:265-525(+)
MEVKVKKIRYPKSLKRYIYIYCKLLNLLMIMFRYQHLDTTSKLKPMIEINKKMLENTEDRDKSTKFAGIDLVNDASVVESSYGYIW